MKYEEIKALNYSSLKHMDVSPAYARHRFDNPCEVEDSKHFLRGRAIHCAILERDQFDSRYVVPPDFVDCAIAEDGEVFPIPNFGDLRYKGPKEDRKRWIEQTTNCTIMKASEYKEYWMNSLPDDTEVISRSEKELALRCSEKVSENKIASKILEGSITEVPIQWDTAGIACKCRLDAVTNLVIDIKTSRYFRSNDCEREAIRYNYHAQLAWYNDGATTVGMIDGSVDPYIIFIGIDNKTSFIDVIPFKVPQDVLSIGRSLYQRWLSEYIGCKKSNWWPGDGERENIMELPEWKVREVFEE